ncbi:hypothetical protein BSL78_00411 [Apostichopus japonicus]|uniref:Uncharacterized protein n=1 Tax=Stichopus japonicus TaxID=307972 RepID=A0A2G8LQT2_STIJA|nr:hypothetical protein BSL78_00411 [Apostichopus japonicus]
MYLIAVSAYTFEKRKHFLASAGLLYAPVCTPLSRHLLSDLTRLSSGKEQTGICSKCNCLFLKDSCQVNIEGKPQLKKRLKQLTKKSPGLLTSKERKQLRRWQNRRCKVVVHCKVCEQKATFPGPTAMKPFQRNELRQKQIMSKNQNRRLHKPAKGRVVTKGQKQAKMTKLKEMLKGDKVKRKKASQSPLLKFLSSI